MGGRGPQSAYASISALARDGRVLIHDWNERQRYREVLRWMDVVGGQWPSEQPGGGGLAVLRVKEGVTGLGGAELSEVPTWW